MCNHSLLSSFCVSLLLRHHIPQADRFGDVLGLDIFNPGQVGNRACDLDDAVVASGREMERLEDVFDERFPLRVERTGFRELAMPHLRVAREMPTRETFLLHPAGGRDAFGNHRRWFAFDLRRELGVFRAIDLDVQIDAVQERPGNFSPIALNFPICASAGVRRVAKVAAGA